MEPARVYSFSRSRYISASWSSSTNPTLVSWGVDDTNNSLVMRTPDPAPLRRQDSPEQRQKGQAGSSCCDRPPTRGAARASGFSPRPNPWHKLWNLLHLSHWCCTGFVTALSFEGAVTCPAAL